MALAFTDDPLTPGVTVIRAVHFLELREAVNDARSASGLPRQTFTDPSLAGASVKAIHVTDLRTSVDSVRSQRGLPPFLYTDPALSAGTIVKSVHIQEVREVCRRLIDGCPPISITSPARTTFTVDTAMTATFTQSGAAEGVMFSIATGTLPAGVTLSTSGILAGTPTETGTFPITVTAADRYACTGTSATYTLSIVPPAAISSFTGPANPVIRGATITLVGTFSGGSGLITSDQGHSFVAVSGTEYQHAVTVSTVYTLTVTNAAGDAVATSLTVVVVNVSGTWTVTPRIVYTCAFGLIDLSIGTFTFGASGSSLAVMGAPVTMNGTITGNSFSVSGTLAGSVTETYSLSGVFGTALTSWTGTFTATFVGSQKQDCTNRTFPVSGSRP